MSYHRKGRSSLSGVQSQPPNARVFRHALEGLHEYGLPATGSTKTTVPVPPRTRRALGADWPAASGPPRWYRAMQGATLGADDNGPMELAEPTLTDPLDLQREQLRTLKSMQEQERERIKDEKLRGIFQIAATLSIPLAAFIWKRLLKKPASSP